VKDSFAYVIVSKIEPRDIAVSGKEVTNETAPRIVSGPILAIGVLVASLATHLDKNAHVRLTIEEDADITAGSALPIAVATSFGGSPIKFANPIQTAQYIFKRDGNWPCEG